MKSIYHDCQVTVLGAQVLDANYFTGAGVDMSGYEGVAFVVGNADGSVVTGYHVKAQQDTTSGFGTAADLEGSDISFASITGIYTNVLDINKPTERWVRPIVTVPNTAATAVTVVTAIRYGGKILPESNTGEYHTGSAEGTA